MSNINVECLRADPKTELFNTRYKGVVNAYGEYQLIQTMTADTPIFNPHKIEAGGSRTNVRLSQRMQDCFAEWEVENMSSAMADRIETRAADKWERSVRRAKTHISDYILADYRLLYFITLTLSGEHFDRADVKTACEKLNNYLRNRVQRNGLSYLIVPEYHHDGKCIHFHGVINEALPMEDSGTVIRPDGGKPVKVATAIRQGYALDDCKPVYNIPSWEYGFTTAIKMTGDRGKCASYVSKYISKNVADGGSAMKKIGGRFYYSGGDLLKPRFSYANTDFENADGYLFETPGATFKISRPDTF